jgi:predicted enzyme related to lactoylglutathione lyase
MSAHSIVHIEIPTSNLEQSGRFYNQLFGWKITSVPEMNYALWEPTEGPAGGFSPIGPDIAPGQILLHVASDDIEADLERAKVLGATVLRPKTEIPDIGWWGVFRDPSGNAVALFTGRNPQATRA